MPKDSRLYFKLTLDFTDHAKIFPLSDAAFRCLVEAIAYSRRQETDGLLARRYALAKWSPEVLRELCENDPEKPSLIERPDGWIIHDYAEMNDTAAEIEARRERNRQAGKQGGLAKSYRSARRAASESLSKSVSESLAEEEKEKEKEITTYVGKSSNVSNARDAVPPTSLPAVSATPGAELVREIVPKGHPAATMTSLRLQASELLNTGTDPDTVAEALRLWCDKPGVGIGRTILASLCSEAIKNRNGAGTLARNGSRGPTGTQVAYDNLDRLAAKYATESAYPADDYAEIQGELL